MANLDFTNIQINPCVLQWGNQAMDKVVVGVVPAVADYFELSAPSGDFYVYYNTDPALSGKTGILVTLPGSPTVVNVAAATATAIEANANFHCKAYTENGVTFLIIQRRDMGPCAAAADGAITTGFTFSVVRAGSLLDIGLTEDIELGLQVSLLDVTASQLGTTIVERLRNGMNIENVSISMKESVAAKLQAIMQPHFPEYTPSNSTPVAVQGIGNSKDFLNVSADSAKLVMHPVRLLDSNLAEDWAFFRASPLLTGINFSGESEQMLTVEFSILPDKYLAKEVQHGVYGDHSQNFLK